VGNDPTEKATYPYRSLRERASGSDPGRSDEFPSGYFDAILADGISRRRFLSLASASAALALGTVSCSRIDRGTIVPYTRKPEEVLPGVANYYASTFQEGPFTSGVLVRTREGRPIHVEGNPEHPFSRGKTNLRAIGDILGLYDPDRMKAPSANGAPLSWQKALEEISGILRPAGEARNPILLLTDAVLSPTRKTLIEEFKTVLPGLRHVAWEPAAPETSLAAARELYGESALPVLRYDRADTILALHSDFLGAEPGSELAARDFAARRRGARTNGDMNRLWVVESGMTLTGANADHRLQVKPSRVAALAFALARSLNEMHGVPLPAGVKPEILSAFSLENLAKELNLPSSLLKSLAEDLRRAGKNTLVVAGPAIPVEAHVACGLLNSMLGCEGNTIDAALSAPAPELLQLSGLREILLAASQSTFAAAIFWRVNPAYAFPDNALWKQAVAKIPATLRIGLYEDETALDCRWRLPEHHWLESWGDFQAAADCLSLQQPTIGAIYDSRQGEDILLSLLGTLKGSSPQPYPDYLKDRWSKEVYPAASPVSFERFWVTALHDGIVKVPAAPKPARMVRSAAVAEGAANAAKALVSPGGDFELVILPGTALHDGRYANNGWLCELPDPVTKATWTNPVLLSVADAARLGVKDDDLVNLTVGGRSLRVPVVIQPGQTSGVASIALGYGRATGNVAAGVGVNAYPLLDISSSSFLRQGVSIARAGGTLKVPKTQEHHRIDGHDLVRSWTVAELNHKAEEKGEAEENTSLIPGYEFPGHKWGMAIDLSACVGCSACVVACQSENNIPVVGPERVIVSREMQWIRVDRYYSGDPAAPEVYHQPMLCQHCDDAPCEIVCPVNATTHSPDGLTQMTYNRCVGTRYCSNNCPFKVRRFNFFDYTSMKKAPEIFVFNPEVTVRPRGVMEKCSFCIQRIQDVRQRANVEGRPVRDGEIRPACAAACPADALVFGDWNDPESRLMQITKTPRSYKLLTELGVKPSVTYLADIKNPASGEGKA
jgi:Fe-S-cluster-containing dehydrogenase component